MTIEAWDEARDGPLTEAALRRKMEQRGYQVSRYVYPPGTQFPNHSHEMDKLDAVVSGQFCIVLAGRRHVLKPGDLIEVPAGITHSAEVLGGLPVVSLDGVRVS